MWLEPISEHIRAIKNYKLKGHANEFMPEHNRKHYILKGKKDNDE